MKLDKDELWVEDHFDEFRRVAGFEKRKKSLQSYAKLAANKTKRCNIRLTEHDFKAIQMKAVDEGLPYQTLIGSLVHKYVMGRLKEVR